MEFYSSLYTQAHPFPRLLDNTDFRKFRVLRIRAFFHKVVGVCHVYFNFKLGYRCRITTFLEQRKIEVIQLIFLHQTIVLATGTYFKMVSIQRKNS